MSKLLREVRKMENLYSSWRKVRSNIISKGSSHFRAEVDKIDLNPIKRLRQIQSKLYNNSFRFEKQLGRLHQGRPLVIAPINNRIVQRAILNVLQSTSLPTMSLLGNIPQVVRTETSVGGVPDKGVQYGINLVAKAIQDEASDFIRSDICKFFTKIPHEPIVNYIFQETGDAEFSTFFARALETEISNPKRLGNDLKLFPSQGIGVPQGSSLSAIAGNILLKDFDQQMNCHGVVTIRYIDDFVMLGRGCKITSKAFESARKLLSQYGLDVYEPDGSTDKAAKGLTSKGFEFLGCRIEASNISASNKSCQKHLEDVDGFLSSSQAQIDKFAAGTDPRRAERALLQSLAVLDDKIRGWGDAYAFTNNRRPLLWLDEKIDRRITDFLGANLRRINSQSPIVKRRMLGITTLHDIPRQSRSC